MSLSSTNAIGLRPQLSVCWLAAVLVLAGAALPVERAAAQDIPAYGGVWPVLHHDHRNSDCSPEAIANGYSRWFLNNFYQVNYNRPVIDSAGDVYFTYAALSVEDGVITNTTPSFSGFDGITGEQLFTVTTPTVDQGIITGNALVGSDGFLYVSDDTKVTKLNAAGVPQWTTPIRGAVASSLQFTPAGHVLAFTWNGWAHVIARSDGHIVLEQNMAPGRTYPASRPAGCLLNGNNRQCAYSNTPAISPADAKIYQTYMPADPTKLAAVHAYRLTSTGLNLLWSNASLTGGTASSVAISRDYQRLYVADNANHLVALRASNGTTLWTVNIGFAPRSSCIVNDNGYLMPGGSAQDPDYKIALIRDNGTSASLVYENRDYVPISNSVAGAGNRFAVIARNKLTDGVELLVFDPNGIISSSPWGDSYPPDQLGGLVINEDGWMYVTGVDGKSGLAAFRPYIDHQDVETGMFSETTAMISLRYMRHMWTASDGTMVAVVQQGGYEGHGLSLYRSLDHGQTWEFGLDLASDVVVSDGTLLADNSLLLVTSILSETAVADIGFIRLNYDGSGKQWAMDAASPSVVLDSTPTFSGSRATVAVDSNGVVWSAFRSGESGIFQIRLFYSEDDGLTWEDSGNGFTTPNVYAEKGAKVLAVDGGIALVLQNQRGPLLAPQRFKSWAFRSDSDALTALVFSEDIAQMQAVDADPYGSHWSVAADSLGNLHMSFQDATIQYVKHDAATGTWSSPLALGEGDVTYNSVSISENNDVYVFARFEAADKVYATRLMSTDWTWSEWTSVSRQPYEGFLRMASPEHFDGDRVPLLYQVSSTPSRLLYNDVASDFLDTLE